MTLDRAPIYTNLYAQLGVADELRAAFVVALDMQAQRSAAMLVVDRDNQVQDLTIEAGHLLEDLRTVAVMIEPARAADLTPILLEAYGLLDGFHAAVHRSD